MHNNSAQSSKYTLIMGGQNKLSQTVLPRQSLSPLLHRRSYMLGVLGWGHKLKHWGTSCSK